MPNRSNFRTNLAWVLLAVGILVAGPKNWFYDNATGTHFDAAQFRQPISVLGMLMVVAAFAIVLFAKRSNK